MRKAIALILFVLFSLGTFGVTIEQHLCCHASTAQNIAEPDHCNDDESCCEENDGCCDEIVSQVKIPKDFTSQSSKISFELSASIIPTPSKFYSPLVSVSLEDTNEYASVCYFPPPADFQVLYSSFLI